MTLQEYKDLTGLTVATSDEDRVTAQIARTRRILEQMLGYTLDANQVNTNYYQEQGKSNSTISCPIIETEDLDDPDDVVTAYRLYNLNEKDEYWHIDPFTSLNAVKLVYIKQGSSPNGITAKTFDAKYIREHKIRDNWSKYIQYYPYSFDTTCGNYYLQLAVDAVWQWPSNSNIPDDLKDVWADMVTYYSDSQKDIKREAILTHSYTKFDREVPEKEPQNLNILSRYAGPNGTLGKMHVL